MLIIYVFVIVFLGRQFGAGLIYWLTRLLGNVIISWFTRRYKKAEKNWENVTEKISTQAPMPIALVRLTGLMTLASVLSGAMQIRYISFFLGVAFSALIFDGSLIILGLITKYGFRFIGFTPSVWHVALGLIILMSIFMVVVTIINRRRQTALDKSNKP